MPRITTTQLAQQIEQLKTQIPSIDEFTALVHARLKDQLVNSTMRQFNKKTEQFYSRATQLLAIVGVLITAATLGGIVSANDFVQTVVESSRSDVHNVIATEIHKATEFPTNLVKTIGVAESKVAESKERFEALFLKLQDLESRLSKKESEFKKVDDTINSFHASLLELEQEIKKSGTDTGKFFAELLNVSKQLATIEEHTRQIQQLKQAFGAISIRTHVYPLNNINSPVMKGNPARGGDWSSERGFHVLNQTPFEFELSRKCDVEFACAAFVKLPGDFTEHTELSTSCRLVEVGGSHLEKWSGILSDTGGIANIKRVLRNTQPTINLNTVDNGDPATHLAAIDSDRFLPGSYAIAGLGPGRYKLQIGLHISNTLVEPIVRDLRITMTTLPEFKDN